MVSRTGESMNESRGSRGEAKRVVGGTPSAVRQSGLQYRKRTEGAPVSELDRLVNSNTVTLPALLKLAPHLPDPTSTLYNSTMYLMAGLLVIALAANLCVRPVDSKHWMREE